jgi:glutaredoxin
MKLALSFCSLLLLCSVNAHAQLYKWVGPDGKITYSDTPPPKNVTQVEEKSMSDSSTTAGSNLPYELSQAVKTSPVVLYTQDNCPACDQGRQLLQTRGIPFKEKTVSTSEDIARLKKVGGDQQLPLLTVGRSVQQGFQADTWKKLLSVSGYPETNMLPSTYHNPSPEPAAGKPNVAANKTSPKATGNENKTSAPSDVLLPAAGNAPPGFRF